MSSYQAPDFYNIDSLLSEDERRLRDRVRDFVSKEIIPFIDDWFIDETFPKHLMKPFGELGVFGPTIKGYGCAGLGNVSYGLIMQEIERGDSGLRSVVSVQGALAMYPIAQFGTDEQKKKYLPKMAKGELIGCFGLTEPDHGSNPAGMTTTARKDGSDYVLNGKKKWLTNGSAADLAIIWAKVDGKVHGFIVETDVKGLTRRLIGKKYSLRASVSSEFDFDDVRVPASQMLGVSGFGGPFSCLNQARYGISWGAMGAASACFDEARRYAMKRVQFDKPLAGFQLVQAKLVEMSTEITKGQLLALQLGRLLDQGKAEPVQISMAKMNNVSWALKIARQARDILGAVGVTHEYQTGRHMLNLESVNTYEGTEDIHRLIIGEHITGLAAFK